MSQKKSTKTTKSAKKTGNSKKKPAYPEETYLERSFTLSNSFFGVIFSFLAVFIFVGMFNEDGKFIIWLSKYLKGIIGYGYWFCVPVFISCALMYFLNNKKKVTGRIICTLMLPILLSAVISLVSDSPQNSEHDLVKFCEKLFMTGKNLKSGGAIGGLLATGLENAFNLYGAMAILIVLFLCCFFFAYKISLKSLFTSQENVSDYPAEADNGKDRIEESVPARAKVKKKKTQSFDLPLSAFDEDDLSAVQEPVKKVESRRKTPAVLTDFPDDDDDVILSPISSKKKNPDADKTGKTLQGSKTVTSVKKPEKPIEKVTVVSEDEFNSEYTFPPVELLNPGPNIRMDSEDEIDANKERLRNALHSFGINAEIVNIIHGPTVTRYDIELEQGVKLSRVTNLSGDIALSLGVINVRISPIPDKISTVGIEVPNKIISTVYLRDIISSQEFISAKSKLSFAIGKDIGGNAIVGNIAKLPHLLIAGTTGSGKSVCMNSLILSLLYKAGPDEVRLIMIDPKMVELGVYNGIPHLYVPVVTDPKKASGALQWTVVEMLKRYSMFSDAKVRDILSYNKLCTAKGEMPLPNIVVVIDELADLMMIASKEVEESICRVAQMGRAAGMHLIIATQRPSADIITGLMKANIPSRIAFAVSSAMESRIILDQGGADKLVGMGDMLFSPVGCGKPTRIQGAYVSDEEREEVINFIKEHSDFKSSYNAEIDDFMNKALQDKKSDSGKDGDGASSDSDYDDMLSKAVETVIDNPEAGCSVSMLQRRVKLGYARAARIVDQMEELGIVGPYEGAKPRKVIADRAKWEEIKRSIGLSSDDSELF